MKKFFVITIVFVVFMLVCGAARSEREESLKNGVYRLDEVTRTNLRTVTNVPTGLSISDVVNLTTGKKKEVTIEDKIGKLYFFLSFPLIKNRIDYSDKVVAYKNGQWSINPASRVRLSNYYAYTIVGLWMPVLLIAMISIVNLLYENGIRKLLVFYGALLGASAAGAFFGAFSVFIGAAAGAIGGAYACESKKLVFWMGGVPTLIGAIAGALIGILSSTINEITHFVYFLLAVEVVSFCIAQLVILEKKRQWTMAEGRKK